ncbi:UNVERIFIED_CONTAM: hypothetical protein FKN15_027901 [Acipenser sinensis]
MPAASASTTATSRGREPAGPASASRGSMPAGPPAAARRGGAPAAFAGRRGGAPAAFAARRGGAPAAFAGRRGGAPAAFAARRGGAPAAFAEGEEALPPLQPEGEEALPPLQPEGEEALPPLQPEGEEALPPLQPEGEEALPPSQPEGEEALPPSQPEGEEPLPPLPSRGEEEELPLPPTPPLGEVELLLPPSWPGAPLPPSSGPACCSASPGVACVSLASPRVAAGPASPPEGPLPPSPPEGPLPPLPPEAPLPPSPPEGPLPPSPPEGPLPPLPGVIAGFVLLGVTASPSWQQGILWPEPHRGELPATENGGEIKQTQDEEKKQLTALRDLIKSSLQLDQKEDSQSKQGGYSMHQLQGNKEFGSEKKGYLAKKSDGLRKVWQRRKCCVKNGILTISHATSNRQPVKLNLLTCQVKPSGEDKKCFDLISHNRTYHFQAEDEQEFVIWISVLTNNKEEALNMAFRGEQSTGENSVEDLTKAIIEDVLRMPGNEVCCDCGAQAAQYWHRKIWFSNLMKLSSQLWRLPEHRDLLSQARGTLWHPDQSNLQVWVWPLKGCGPYGIPTNRTCRWYSQVACGCFCVNIFDLAAINALVLYKECIGNTITRRDIILQLALELRQKHFDKRHESRLANAPQPSASAAPTGTWNKRQGQHAKTCAECDHVRTDSLSVNPEMVTDPKWLSTNLGILTCIECSGTHREMGVHISRIQSMELDKLGTSELLLAKNVGNCSFNEIMEGNLPCPSPKPTPSSDMTARKEFINAKYVDHKFTKKTCISAAAKMNELFDAVKSRDLLALIQVCAEGVELMEPLPETGQLVQASAGKFNPHVHVEYEWNLVLEEIDESDDDLDDKPSPIKKERSPRPQSFCHSSSLSPQDKLALPGFGSQRDKQRLSYGAFTNQMYDSATDSPTSPVIDAPPLPPSNTSKESSPSPPTRNRSHSSRHSDTDRVAEQMEKLFEAMNQQQSLLTELLQGQGVVTGCTCNTRAYVWASCGASPPGPLSTLPLGTQPPSGSSTLSKKRPPPPPPGHKRTLSDLPSPLPHGSQNKGVTHWGNDPGPASTNKTSTGNKFEGIPQQQSTGTTKSTLGPRVLPKLPQKVTLRKIDTIHHPSIEKPSQPPEVFQKSPQPIEIPQKPQLGEKPQSVDLPPKLQIGELPLKPGELPPKPQLSDLPPKPQLGDLPPKPQIKDLPPKPQLTEMPPKPQSGESLQKSPPLEVAAKPQPVEIPSNLSGDAVQNQPSEDTNGTAPCLTEMPVPLPRKINAGKNKVRRVKTIYDCQADNDDELTFVEGEVIIVTGEEEQEWWVMIFISGFPQGHYGNI